MIQSTSADSPAQKMVTSNADDKGKGIVERESTCSKSTKRVLTPNVTINPFKQEESYMAVLDKQHIFLRPRSTYHVEQRS